MNRRPVPYLLVLLALAAFGGLAFPTGTPAAAQVARTADYVVIVGIPGLRWEDVSETTTLFLSHIMNGPFNRSA